jgi:hypothetical protein
VNLAREQIRELASNLIRHTIWSGTLGHRRLGIWNLEF